jgi:hypothetical protein
MDDQHTSDDEDKVIIDRYGGVWAGTGCFNVRWKEPVVREYYVQVRVHAASLDMWGRASRWDTCTNAGVESLNLERPNALRGHTVNQQLELEAEREKLEGETSRAALLRVHLQHALREREVVFTHEPEPVHEASAPSVVYTDTCEFATPVVEEATRDGTSVVYTDTCEFPTPVVEEGTRDGTSVVYTDTCIPLCDAETMGGTLN